MAWILIGLLGGSLITSLHDTREACEGRAVVLRETKGLVAKCVELPRNSYITSGSVISICPGTYSCPPN
jgi:hypothetical protein